MKKNYTTPEMEVVRYTLRDVILASITEGEIPTQMDEPVLPGDDDDFILG